MRFLKLIYLFAFLLAVIFSIPHNKVQETQKLKLSNYVTLVVIVPESHADLIRKVMGDAGAGKTEHYSHGSFSVKGMSRFIPESGSHPFIGKENQIETVIEERIETICSLENLEKVITALKEAHPYEETIIDIFPIWVEKTITYFIPLHPALRSKSNLKRPLVVSDCISNRIEPCGLKTVLEK